MLFSDAEARRCTINKKSIELQFGQGQNRNQRSYNFMNKGEFQDFQTRTLNFTFWCVID